LAQKFRENGFNIGDTISNIIPVIFRDSTQIMNIHKYMMDKGFFLSCVQAPAVPVNAPRFRICATSNMTVAEMDLLVDSLVKGQQEFPENKEIIELFD